jgi:hypothetical protein
VVIPSNSAIAFLEAADRAWFTRIEQHDHVGLPDEMLVTPRRVVLVDFADTASEYRGGC